MGPPPCTPCVPVTSRSGTGDGRRGLGQVRRGLYSTGSSVVRLTSVCTGRPCRHVDGELHDVALTHGSAYITPVRADPPGPCQGLHEADSAGSTTHTAGWGQLREDAGLAVRFPRFSRRWRDDKAPTDATTMTEAIGMYRAARQAPPVPGLGSSRTRTSSPVSRRAPLVSHG
jgi:ATP-dependent DNA ligase